MIEQLTGNVKATYPQAVLLQVSSIVFLIHVVSTQNIAVQQDVTLFIHWHWSAEKGPSLYGFVKEVEKMAFQMLLDCPKIGPQIALQILGQLSTERLVNMLVAGDEIGLSGLVGIGSKKAKTLVVELQDKAKKFMLNFSLNTRDEAAGNVMLLEDVVNTLKSMGYAAAEISAAIAATDKEVLKNADFAGKVRCLLAQLLAQKKTGVVGNKEKMG